MIQIIGNPWSCHCSIYETCNFFKEKYNAPAGTATDGYFTGVAAYATASTKTDRLHQIWMQRRLLDFFTSNLNYQNFLRTGYPVFPLDPATSMNPDDKIGYPKRWKYDTGELATNPVNYKKAVDEQFGGYDGINEVPWWLK